MNRPSMFEPMHFVSVAPGLAFETTIVLRLMLHDESGRTQKLSLCPVRRSARANHRLQLCNLPCASSHVIEVSLSDAPDLNVRLGRRASAES